MQYIKLLIPNAVALQTAQSIQEGSVISKNSLSKIGIKIVVDGELAQPREWTWPTIWDDPMATAIIRTFILVDQAFEYQLFDNGNFAFDYSKPIYHLGYELSFVTFKDVANAPVSVLMTPDIDGLGVQYIDTDNAQLTTPIAQSCSNGILSFEPNARVRSTDGNNFAFAGGINNAAKGQFGSWLILTEYGRDEEDDATTPLRLIGVKSVQVDGYSIKIDTYYCLRDGNIVEVE